MKTLIIFIIASAFTIYLPQQSKVDSLQVMIKSSQDSVRARLYNELSSYYRGRDPAKSLEAAQTALRLATSSGTKQQEAFAKNNIGLYYMAIGENDKAIQFLQSALAVVKQTTDKSLTARINNNVGAVYFSLSDFSNALDFYIKGLKLREELHDTGGTAASLSNIGNVHNKLGSFKVALTYYNQALELQQKLKDANGALMTTINIATVYYGLQDFENALNQNESALAMCKQLGIDLYLPTIYTNIGGVYYEKKLYAEALKYHQQALVIQERNGDQYNKAMSLMNIGQVYFDMKQTAKALQCLENAVTLAKQMEALDIEKNCASSLASIYAKQGNYKKAFEYQSRYTVLKDSLFGEEKAGEIGKMEERYQIEKAQAEQKHIEEEEARIATEQGRRRNMMQYFGIALFMIILFIAIFLNGKFHLNQRFVEGLTFFFLILLFEFLNVLLDPELDAISRSIPLIKWLCNACVALALTPLNGGLEHFIMKRLGKEKEGLV